MTSTGAGGGGGGGGGEASWFSPDPEGSAVVSVGMASGTASPAGLGVVPCGGASTVASGVVAGCSEGSGAGGAFPVSTVVNWLCWTRMTTRQAYLLGYYHYYCWSHLPSGLPGGYRRRQPVYGDRQWAVVLVLVVVAEALVHWP